MPPRRAPARVSTRPPRAPRPPKDPRHAGNAPKTQRQRPPHPGEEARIAARRVRVLDLRKSGASYRVIAKTLNVDVATAWADVHAELGELRRLAASGAEDVKALELQRLDALTAGLFKKATQRGGDQGAVTALVRVSERRAKLLGLDAPVKLAGPTGGPVLERVQLYLPDNGRRRREATP